MYRRRFLTLVGLGGAAGLAACTGSSGPHRSRAPSGHGSTARATSGGPTTATSTPTSRPNAVRAPTSLDQLERQLDGRLIAKGAPGYRTARRSYDPFYDHLRPAAVVRCTSSDDVARTLEYASAAGTRAAARSGGHSYAGYSTPGKGLVLDLSPMSQVRVSGDTVRVGAGARLIEVYTALGKAGRCLPAGSCPTVGIGGLALGGGVGVLSRSFGLTCDRLLDADVVTADGTVHHVSADAGSDLFWALRGGGGGNVGVVTSFTFSTEPAPEVVKFGLQFPNGTAADVFDAWQHVSTTAPDRLNISVSVTASESPYAFVYGTYLGSLAAARQSLDAFVARVGVRPDYRQVSSMSVEAAMYAYAKSTGKSLAQAGPDWTGNPTGTIPRDTFVGTSRILRSAIDPAEFVNAIAGSDTAVLVDSISGAAGRPAPSATAFAHRGALATVQIYQSGSDRSAIDSVRTRLGKLMGPYGYVNYIDPAMPHWGRAYYAGNLARLQSVAHRYDPDGVLRFAQNVANA